MEVAKKDLQDLVEAEIFYGAIPHEALAPAVSGPEGGGNIFTSDFFEGEEELFARLAPDSALPPGLVSVYEPDDLLFSSDVINGSCLCGRGQQTRR